MKKSFASEYALTVKASTSIQMMKQKLLKIT